MARTAPKRGFAYVEARQGLGRSRCALPFDVSVAERQLGADSPCRFPDLRDLQRSRHVLFLPSWKEITAGYRQFLLGAVWILSSTEHFILLNQLSSEAGPPRLLRVVLRRLIRLEGVLRNVGQSADVPSIAPLRTSKPVIGHPDCAGSVRPRPRRQDKPHPVCTDRTFSR